MASAIVFNGGNVLVQRTVSDISLIYGQLSLNLSINAGNKLQG